METENKAKIQVIVKKGKSVLQAIGLSPEEAGDLKRALKLTKYNPARGVSGAVNYSCRGTNVRFRVTKQGNFSISSGRQALPNSSTHHMMRKDLFQDT